MTAPVRGSTPARVADTIRRSPVASAAVIVAAVAVGWLVVRMTTMGWHPMGDYRNLEFRIADVGGGNTPLVGPWSRFDWNHPGPWVFWSLAGPYRLFGEVGILLGAAAVNIAAVVAAIAVCAGAGRRWVAVAALSAALLCGGIGLGGLADPWNPYMVVLPTFALCIGTWRAIDGSRAGALLAVIAGSFAAATHFGSMPIAVAMVTVVAVALVVRAVRGDDRRHDRRTLVWCATAGVVMWLPPFIQQFTDPPGNLRLLASFIVNGGRDGVNGPGSGLRIMSRSMGITFDWVTGRSPTLASGLLGTSWAVPVGLFALVAAAIAAARWRDRRGLLLCGVAAFALVVETAAMSRISGPLFPALVRTTWSVAAVVWMAVLGVLAGRLARVPARERVVSSVVAGAVAVVLAVTLVRGVDVAPLQPPASWASADAAMTAAIVTATAEAPAPVLVVNGFGVDGAIGTEVLAVARAAGLSVFKPAPDAFIVGSQRTTDPSEVATTIAIVADGSVDELLSDPAWRLIVRYDPLTAAERAELEALEAAPSAALDTSAMTPAEAAEARRAALDVWRLDQASRPRASAEYERFRELANTGSVLAAFERSGPP